jgi:hypothetical protein
MENMSEKEKEQRGYTADENDRGGSCGGGGQRGDTSAGQSKGMGSERDEMFDDDDGGLLGGGGFDRSDATLAGDSTKRGKP